MNRQARSKKSNSRQVVFTRFMFVVAFFVLWLGGISVRLVHVQVNQHAWLKDQAIGQRQNVKNTRMLRGTIYDRNERALAMSLPVKTLYADPGEIDDIDTAAKAIAKALNLDSNQLVALLTQAKADNKRFIALVKKVEDDLVQKINKALDDPKVKKSDAPNFYGLHWRDGQRRAIRTSRWPLILSVLPMLMTTVRPVSSSRKMRSCMVP